MTLTFLVKFTHSFLQPESPPSPTHTNLGDEFILSNESSSTGVANSGTVGYTVDTPTDVYSQPNPWDNSIDLQGDEWQLGDPEDITETGMESRWSHPLLFLFILLFFVVFFGAAAT